MISTYLARRPMKEPTVSEHFGSTSTLNNSKMEERLRDGYRASRAAEVFRSVKNNH